MGKRKKDAEPPANATEPGLAEAGTQASCTRAARGSGGNNYVRDVLSLSDLVGSQTRWDLVLQTLSTSSSQITSVKDLEARVQAYSPGTSLAGLFAALNGEGGGSAIPEDKFCIEILPCILNSALRLVSLIGDGLPIMKQLTPAGSGEASIQQRMSRELCHCLIANMFLCIFTDHGLDTMPDRSFQMLLRDRDSPQEMAKLRMFVHYFERTAAAAPQGELRLTRRAVSHVDEAWKVSKAPLLPMQVVPMNIGFEDPEYGHGCLHADFANMFLGGGVLSGGCVQEEIRFSICPELVAAMVVSPVMTAAEAIEIIGGEQYSAYAGYGWSLRYKGDFKDTCAVDADGTVLNGITAIDALDGRRGNFDFEYQLRRENMLRELNKASAGFSMPVGDRTFPCIATGNWGCGVFGGHVQLKAVLQWIAASHGNAPLRYFPFNQTCGSDLEVFAADCVEQEVTAGQLWCALLRMSEKNSEDREAEFFDELWVEI